MSDRDFDIKGKKFKLNKMDAFKQFHIVRRIAPLLSEMLPVMGSIAKVSKANSGQSESEKLEQFAQIAQPILLGLSKLSDADSNRVLFGLLSSVEVQQEHGNWARISSDDALMMNDLELPVLLQAAGRAFAYNLSGFFAALPQAT